MQNMDACLHWKLCALIAFIVWCFHGSAVALERCKFEAAYLDLVLHENNVKHIALNFLLLALLSLFCMKNSCTSTASLCLLFCLDLGPNEKPCEHTHTLQLTFFACSFTVLVHDSPKRRLSVVHCNHMVYMPVSGFGHLVAA